MSISCIELEVGWCRSWVSDAVAEGKHNHPIFNVAGLPPGGRDGGENAQREENGFHDSGLWLANGEELRGSE